MKIISIEGNIGAGKSTLLDKLKKEYPEFNYVPEPVDTWMNICDSDNKNILKNFYTDFNRWSYTFQNFAFITRHTIMQDAIKTKNKSDIFISERSIYTDKNVFAKMLYDDKLMTELEYKIYNYWFDKLSENNEVDKYIFLTTNVDLSDKRIKIRNREGENISHDYLTRLDKYHHDWLVNEKKPVLFFDTEKDNIKKIINFII
jgi:deoxyadenosine/deoxycytidine kinase